MDPKLVAYYRGSVGRRIVVLEAARQRLGEGTEADEAGKEIRQIAHSLKGTGRSYGFPEVSDAALEVEEAQSGADLSPSLDQLLEVLRAVAEFGGEP